MRLLARSGHPLHPGEFAATIQTPDGIINAAHARELTVPDPDEFTTLPGLGVRARIDEGEVIIGRPQLLAEEGITVAEEVVARARDLAAVGRTVILVAHQERVAGMLVLEDSLRPEAGQVIRRLVKLGIRTVLVTALTN